MSEGNCNMTAETHQILRRCSFVTGFCGLAAAAIAKRRGTAAGGVIDVRAVGASGHGKAWDLRQIQQAMQLAAERPARASVFSPPAEYYLNVTVEGLRNCRFDSVLSAVTWRSFDRRARAGGITLTNL